MGRSVKVRNQSARQNSGRGHRVADIWRCYALVVIQNSSKKRELQRL